MNTYMGEQIEELDYYAKKLEVPGRSRSDRRKQVEYVLGATGYLHFHPARAKAPRHSARMRWRPRKWDYARSRIWLLEPARMAYYHWMAEHRPDHLEHLIDAIEVSEDWIRRGREVQLPGLPPGLVENFSMGFGIATVIFSCHDPVRRQIDAITPYLKRTNYRALLAPPECHRGKAKHPDRMHVAAGGTV